MRVDLLVVGASFAGLACARAAARAGLSVLVLEKKPRAGAKLHTTGLIVKDAVDQLPWLADAPRALIRRIEAVRLYAPNMRHVDLHAPGYYFWATDTPALLDWMAALARASGAMIELGALFQDARRAGGIWHAAVNQRTVQARYIIGADGPCSRVARALGLSRNTEFLYGVEHEYAAARMAPGLLHCFIDRQLAPGYIAWAFQGVAVSQIGLARRLPVNSAGPVRLDALLDKIKPVVRPGASPPVAVRAGLIPCGGTLPNVAREGALLIGDAAGVVSPVTAGGIHRALKQGQDAGIAVARFLRGEAADPAAWFVRGYPRLRAKRMLRWAFDHFQSDRVFNSLLSTAPMRHAAALIYFHQKSGSPPAPPASSRPRSARLHP